jgi:hypothetical protein
MTGSPVAADESRWFVYRDPVALAAQMGEIGLEIQQAEQVHASRRWWTVLGSPI